MPKQRYIQDSFWVDPYVEQLPIDAKLLFLYLLTNPLCNVAGIYEITKSRISLETGIRKAQVCRYLEKFREDEKILLHENWILIIHFGKHQATNPNIEKGVERIIKALPDKIKALKGFERLSYFTLLNLTLLNLSDTVAEATPTILINKETYNMEELTYEPIDGSTTKKTNNPYGKNVMAVLVRKYAELTGTEIKGSFDASEWSKPLGVIYRYFDKKPQDAMNYMERAINYYKGKELDFKVHTLAKSIPDTERLINEQDNKNFNPELYE